VTRAAAEPQLPGRILAGLILFLPFEPRRPVLPVFGVEFTLLEVAAAVTTVSLVWCVRRRLWAMLRRPPLPVACLAAFAAVHFLSAAAAPAHAAQAGVYSLRIAAAAALAAAVAACAPPDIRRGIQALVPMAAMVAGLALMEGAGLRALDPLLSPFRDGPYLFEGVRRATATTESPNLAAALLAYGLVVNTASGALAARPSGRSVAVALLLAAGLMLTYSRGGLVAALAGSVVVFGCLRRSRPAMGAVASLVAAAILFAAADAALRRRVFGGWLTQGDGALYEPLDVALVLDPGQARRVAVRVVNTGSSTWFPAAHRLGCAWLDRDRFVDAGCEGRLSRPVAPGDSVSIESLVRAPERPGTYFLVWNVVDRVGPFSSQGIEPGIVPASVGLGETALPAHRPTIVSPRSRWRLWKVAWRMWLARPLLGFGPDNYRKLHASFGGWPAGREALADSAHSAYLEAAASTGALGLVALLATLGAALASARRALRHAVAPEDRGAAAAVLGLAAAIITHATVDFLLGFTAHYVLFAVVIGGATALARRGDLSAPRAAA
jgi:hypothetical protein